MTATHTKALEELVALKDLKERIVRDTTREHKLPGEKVRLLYIEYETRKPAAWEAARAALYALNIHQPNETK